MYRYCIALSTLFMLSPAGAQTLDILRSEQSSEKLRASFVDLTTTALAAETACGFKINSVQLDRMVSTVGLSPNEAARILQSAEAKATIAYKADLFAQPGACAKVLATANRPGHQLLLGKDESSALERARAALPPGTLIPSTNGTICVKPSSGGTPVCAAVE